MDDLLFVDKNRLMGSSHFLESKKRGVAALLPCVFVNILCYASCLASLSHALEIKITKNALKAVKLFPHFITLSLFYFSGLSA